MPLKQKGGLYHQKKRPTSNNRQSSIDLTARPLRPLNAPNRISSLMDVRKQLVFASLVGRRVSISTVDGGAISGTFCLFGNSSLLPWCDDEEDSHPNTNQYHAFERQSSSGVAVQKSSCMHPGIDDDDEGWKIVKQKQKRGSVRCTRSDLPLPTPDDATNRSCCSSASSHTLGLPTNSVSGLPVLIYPQIDPETLKQSSVWLRDAYRKPTVFSKSSKIHDHLAIPWEDIKAIMARDVSDEIITGSDSAQSCVAVPNKLGFQTDVEIAAGASRWPANHRALQRWCADDDVETNRKDAVSWNVEDQQSTTWDQFSVNECKFGVKSTYIDGMYSTKLDEHAIPDDYRRKADRIVDEMETSAALRKKTFKGANRSDDSGDDNDDEEARFSAVAGTCRYSGTCQKSLGYLNQRNQQAVSRRSIGHQKVSGVPSLLSNVRPPNQQASQILRPLDVGRLGSNINSKKLENSTITGTAGCPKQTQLNELQLNPSQDEATNGPVEGQQQRSEYTCGVRILQNTQNVASNISGAEAARSVKDNINALNLEPIRNRIQSQPKQPSQQVAISRALEPAPVVVSPPATSSGIIDSQESRRLKKAEFLRSLKQIENNLERRGWIKSEKNCPTKFGDKADENNPPSKGSLPHSEPTCEGAKPGDDIPGERDQGELGFACSPSSLISQDANIGITQTGQPQIIKHQFQLQQLQFQKQFYNGIPIDKNTGRPPVAWSQPAQLIPKSQGGEAEMLTPGDETSYMAKRFFQFNPNASSFTPKGSLSWTVATPPSRNGATSTNGRSPSEQQENGRASQKRTNIVFRPFNAKVAEYRRVARRNQQEWKGEADEPEAKNFFDLFIDAAREGAANQDPAQVLSDWENKLTLSYTDLLRQGNIGPFMAAPIYGQSSGAHQAAAFYAVPNPTGFNPTGNAGFPAPQFVNLAPMMATGRMFTNTAGGTAGLDNIEAAANGAASFHPILFQSHQGPPQRWTNAPSEGQPWLVPTGNTGTTGPYPSAAEVRTYGMLSTTTRPPYMMS